MRDTTPLAAVVFTPQQPVDAVIRAALAGLGLRALGFLQGREGEGGCDCNEIVLTALSDETGGGRRVITQNLGRDSQGCRLNPAALAEVAGWLEAGLAQAAASLPDLMVVNRFGKVEAAGGGMRGVLGQALAAGVPVLVPVRAAHLAAWRDYSGGLAQELPCEAAAIRAWAVALV